MTKASELSTYHDEELVSRLKDARKELTALKFRAATNQLGDVSSIKKLKREIARLITIIHEKELNIVHLKPTQKSEGEVVAKYKAKEGRLFGTKARMVEKELEEEAKKATLVEDESEEYDELYTESDNLDDQDEDFEADTKNQVSNQEVLEEDDAEDSNAEDSNAEDSNKVNANAEDSNKADEDSDLDEEKDSESSDKVAE
jgi:large subunit ribosomal protein L29